MDNQWNINPWDEPKVLLSFEFLKQQNSRLITLLVGPAEAMFVAHEGHLRKIEFFDKALGRFKEGSEGVIRLPEDLPSVIETFLMWLLRDDIDSAYRDPDQSRWFLPVQMMKFADKIQCSPLMARSCQMFWAAKGEIAETGSKYFDAIFEAYNELMPIRARFLPVHLLMTKMRFARFPRPNLVRSYTQMLKADADFWDDFGKHEQIFELVRRMVKEGDHNGNRKLRLLIVGIMAGQLDNGAIFPTIFLEDLGASEFSPRDIGERQSLLTSRYGF